MTKQSPKKSIVKPNDLKFAIIATDVVLWTTINDQLMVRLISINLPPHFVDKFGLPGGLIKPLENAEQAVKRLLKEKANIEPSKIYLEQLYTFSDVKRDPRGRVVAVAYSGIASWDVLSTTERENDEQVRWQNVKNLPALAYDHQKIIALALERLRSRITYTTIAAHFMPKEFTLTELEQVYELILNKDIDKRNFRKKILSLGILKELTKERRGGKFRPARLYSFKSIDTKDIEVL